MKALTRLRTGSHFLRIETGRFLKSPLHPFDRTCEFCELDQPETELHFLMHCPLYNNERKLLFENVKRICPQFALLDNGLNDHQFRYLLSAEGEISRHVAKFIHDALAKRKSVADDMDPVFTPPNNAPFQKTRTRIIKQPLRLIDEM